MLDLLVLGSGIAGLSAALLAAGEHGLRVGVVTKGSLPQGATRWAQGGVAAVLGDTDDTTDAHLADTLSVGVGLCDADAVRVLVDEGPDRVSELIDLGARFDRDADGRLALGREGGHSASRVVHAGGAATGAEIERVLVDAVRRTAAVIHEHAFAVDLVVDAGQCDAVLFGAGGVGSREGGLAGHTVMLCPTIAPDDTERIASRLQSLGASTIDAPMSGGPARAADGSMSLMVACDDALFHQHQALIEALSSKVFRVGARVGDGARTKLVNNLLAGINLVGAAEALVVAQRMGLDVHRMLDVIEQSSGQSWIGSDRMRRALAGDYAPRAHVTLLEKDTGLALRAAQAVGLQGPLGAAAHAVFVRTHEAGMADLDDAAVFRWLGEAMRSSR